MGILRNCDASDAPILFRWRRLERINQWMFSDPPLDLAAHTTWLTSELLRSDRWMRIIESEGQSVGFISLTRSQEPGVLELGIYVGEVGHPGVGSSALRSLVDEAREREFGSLIRADVFADNLAAIASYQRVGFRMDEDFDSHVVKAGILRRVVRFQIELVKFDED